MVRGKAVFILKICIKEVKAKRKEVLESLFYHTNSKDFKKIVKIWVVMLIGILPHVLDPFMKAFGAAVKTEWDYYRLEGENLENLVNN